METHLFIAVCVVCLLIVMCFVLFWVQCIMPNDATHPNEHHQHLCSAPALTPVVDEQPFPTPVVEEMETSKNISEGESAPGSPGVGLTNHVCNGATRIIVNDATPPVAEPSSWFTLVERIQAIVSCILPFMATRHDTTTVAFLDGDIENDTVSITIDAPPPYVEETVANQDSDCDDAPASYKYLFYAFTCVGANTIFAYGAYMGIFDNGAGAKLDDTTALVCWGVMWCMYVGYGIQMSFLRIDLYMRLCATMEPEERVAEGHKRMCCGSSWFIWTWTVYLFFIAYEYSYAVQVILFQLGLNISVLFLGDLLAGFYIWNLSDRDFAGVHVAPAKPLSCVIVCASLLIVPAISVGYYFVVVEQLAVPHGLYIVVILAQVFSCAWILTCILYWGYLSSRELTFNRLFTRACGCVLGMVILFLLYSHTRSFPSDHLMEYYREVMILYLGLPLAGYFVACMCRVLYECVAHSAHPPN